MPTYLRYVFVSMTLSFYLYLELIFLDCVAADVADCRTVVLTKHRWETGASKVGGSAAEWAPFFTISRYIYS